MFGAASAIARLLLAGQDALYADHGSRAKKARLGSVPDTNTADSLNASDGSASFEARRIAGIVPAFKLARRIGQGCFG
jgi:hypothetical protein